MNIDAEERLVEKLQKIEALFARSTRGLLLIDEVDLHLHPRWQRDLLTFLRRKLPNFQIVATTHSPITAQQANENELHYLERRGRSLKLHQFTGVPRRCCCIS